MNDKYRMLGEHITGDPVLTYERKSHEQMTFVLRYKGVHRINQAKKPNQTKTKQKNRMWIMALVLVGVIQ